MLSPWCTEKLSGAGSRSDEFSAGGCGAVKVRDGKGLCPPKWTWRMSNVA